MATLNDFSVLHTRVVKYQKEHNITEPSAAFPFVALEVILEIPLNEVENCIVDGSHDRGIDAIYIEGGDEDANIHLFQFKYTSKPQKMNSNFPGGEIDKTITIIDDIFSMREELEKEVNPNLWRRIQDIQDVFLHVSMPTVTLHLCGNQQEPMDHDKERMERSFRKYPNIQIEYHSLDSLVQNLITKRTRKIDGKLHFVDLQYFDRTDGNVRAVIAVVTALDLVSLIKDDDFPEIIQEDIFEDNIRVYQKNNRINEAIVRSAVDEKNYEFFYLNNGITMTCDNISFTKKRHPLVELTNVQIVNGSQTSHALFEAYKQANDNSILDKVLVLVRIYQIGNTDIASRIVATTNSQTPIYSRDIHSNDPIQKRLEVELLDKGYYYERKKDLHRTQELSRRLDSEVVGQVLMTYYLGRPHEVKSRRKLIFGDFYERIFHKNITAEDILLPFALFKYIEELKERFQKEVRFGNYEQRKLFIPHSSFHILYAFALIIDKYQIKLLRDDLSAIFSHYDQVVEMIAVLAEEGEHERGKKYSHNYYFRDKKLVDRIEQTIKGSN